MNTCLLTVFFDGGCPLCSREIAHYRRLPGAGRIRWLDVTDPCVDLQAYALDRRAAMAEFHVLDEEGHWHRGADGFLRLWECLPGYGCLARACRWLGLVGPMRWGYGKFASWHFRRRCRAGTCGGAKTQAGSGWPKKP